MNDSTKLFIGVGIATGGLLLATRFSSGSTGGSGGSATITTDGPQITRNNTWNLPDIDSSNQSGSYATDYDYAFEKASGQTGVPFALLKAQAIRESSLNPQAYHFDNPSSGASYGLMQVEWNSNNRFSKYCYDDSVLQGGSMLYDPDTNAFLGASIMRDNLNWLMNGSVQGLRDVINAYNTGTPEAKFEAPGNYVNDIMGYYAELIGQEVSL